MQHSSDFSGPGKEAATSGFDVSGHTSSLRVVPGFATSVLSSSQPEVPLNSQGEHVTSTLQGVQNDISAPLEVVGLRVTVPMNAQSPGVTETRPAVEVRAADESVVCEAPISPVVHNDNSVLHSPVAVAIESSDGGSPALNSPQVSGNCADAQHELRGETSSQDVYANVDGAGTSALASSSSNTHAMITPYKRPCTVFVKRHATGQ
ncbi:hypothetical protein V6N13_054742 [Hibiscus sabdariffa]